ncbi:MAG: hypothetical protein WCO00_01240 [Rhodospirillaceae bacterium]
MMAAAAPPDRQACLFDALPATEPRRRRRGRAQPPPEPEAATAGSPESAPTPLPPPPAIPARPAMPIMVRIDAAALSRPDLCDLVRDLGEPSLGFLLIEAAREAKRRLVPDDPEFDEPAEPNPHLLRAIRAAVEELAESE